MDGEYPEVGALRSWWEESGRAAAITPVGEGMATAVKAPGQRGADRSSLAEFKDSAPTSATDKPVYTSGEYKGLLVVCGGIHMPCNSQRNAVQTC